jgi:hypothetical protein
VYHFLPISVSLQDGKKHKQEVIEDYFSDRYETVIIDGLSGGDPWGI